MRISINGRFLSQPTTGVQRFGHEFVNALDRLIARGAVHTTHDVTVLAPGNVRKVPSYSALKVQVRGRLKGHAWEQLELPRLAHGTFLMNLCQLAPLLKREQLVVMHDAAVYAVPWAYSWRFRIWYKALMPLLARRCTKLATVSCFSRAELARYCKVPPERFAVVYESGDHILASEADTSVLRRHRLEPGRFVLAVSSLNPNKNFDGLVRAIGLLNDPGFDIVIAGGSAERVFGSKRPPASTVKHIGYVSDGELRALYEAAACFVYPSFYEGFGLPPLEAMRCGCPVIVSLAASLPEICADAALYCDPHSPRDIAEKISNLMASPSLQARLRAEGLLRAAQFNWESCALSVWEIVGADVATSS